MRLRNWVAREAPRPRTDLETFLGAPAMCPKLRIHKRYINKATVLKGLQWKANMEVVIPRLWLMGEVSVWCAFSGDLPPTPRPSYRHTSGQTFIPPSLMTGGSHSWVSLQQWPSWGESFPTQGLSGAACIWSLQGIRLPLCPSWEHVL